MAVKDPQFPCRVLHIFGQMNRGGAETFIMRVYRQLDREKIQFDFVVHTRDPGHYDEEIRALGGRIFVLPRPSLGNLLKYARKFSEILRNHGPYVAVHSHVHHFSGIPLIIAKRNGVSIRIAHSHTASPDKIDSLLRRSYEISMRKIILRNATHKLCCSRAACNALFSQNKINSSDVRIVPYGIDIESFANVWEKRSILREKLGIPQNHILLGHVGRFHQSKNHDFLISIFEAFIQRVPNSHLILVGDGPLRNHIAQKVITKNLQTRVHFLGVRTDIPDIMAGIDVFLFPSRWEGLGIVVLEAQAAGTPCVVSDRIPPESDLGLGLVDFVSLESGVETWISSVLHGLNKKRPSWEMIRRSFYEKQYDIGSSVRVLESIYLGRS